MLLVLPTLLCVGMYRMHVYSPETQDLLIHSAFCDIPVRHLNMVKSFKRHLNVGVGLACCIIRLIPTHLI